MRNRLTGTATYGVLLLAVVGAGSCELLGDTTLPDYANVADISYVRHVQVLLDDRCVACHDGSATLDLTSWESLVEGSDVGGAVVPFDADRSRLIRMLTTRQGGIHPLEVGGDTIPEVEVAFLRRWIEEGARNDRGEVPYSMPGPRLLVSMPDEALIAVVDPEGQAVSRYVDFERLGFSPFSAPTHLSVIPDGSGWFVSLPGEGVVLRFSADDELNGLAEVDSPGPVSTSADGRWLVVGRALGDVSARVSVVETPDMRVRQVGSVFPETAASAVRPQGDFGFSASRSADQVIIFPTLPGPAEYLGIDGPRHRVSRLLMSAEGTRLVALGDESGHAVLFDVSTPSSTSILGLVADFQSGIRAGALDEMGRLIVLAANGVLHRASLTPGASAQVLGSFSDGVAVSASKGRILVVSTNVSGLYTPSQAFAGVDRVGLVSIIDPTSGAVIRRVELDGFPAASAIR